MPVTDTQVWTTVGFSILLAIAALLAVGAYTSLRGMDDVVLRARMYMNRKRLFAGFLALALGMVAILALALVSLGFMVAVQEATPSAFGGIGFAVALGLLSWGFYNFYALTQPPREQSTPAQEKT